MYTFIMYTTFCPHARREHQISLQMLVSHHVVAENWTQELWKSSQCALNHLAISPALQTFFYLSSKPSVLATCPPAHMFLAMPSKPEEHPTSALDPGNEPPPFRPQQTATSTSPAPRFPPTVLSAPLAPSSSRVPCHCSRHSSTHFHPSSHVLSRC